MAVWLVEDFYFFFFTFGVGPQVIHSSHEFSLFIDLCKCSISPMTQKIDTGIYGNCVAIVWKRKIVKSGQSSKMVNHQKVMFNLNERMFYKNWTVIRNKMRNKMHGLFLGWWTPLRWTEPYLERKLDAEIKFSIHLYKALLYIYFSHL